MKFTKLILITMVTLFLISCSKEDSDTTGNTVDPTSIITGKWWCFKPGTNTVAGQLFNVDGTWEQGNNGGSFNDKGNWKLESNKKTITISNVKDNKGVSKAGWTYEITSATSESLMMKFGIFSMDLIPCK